jgi:hypothetical protein
MQTMRDMAALLPAHTASRRGDGAASSLSDRRAVLACPIPI